MDQQVQPVLSVVASKLPHHLIWQDDEQDVDTTVTLHDEANVQGVKMDHPVVVRLIPRRTLHFFGISPQNLLIHIIVDAPHGTDNIAKDHGTG
jgi:hypothetical protein